MGNWRTCLACLVASSVVATPSVAKLESHFLISVKPDDITPHEEERGALPVVSEQGELAEEQDQKGDSLTVYPTERLPDGKGEGETEELREYVNALGEAAKDRKEQSKPEETAENGVVDRMGEKENNKEKNSEEAQLSEEVFTDHLRSYLPLPLSIRPQQRVLPPRPISLSINPHSSATLPLFPVTLKWSTLPAFPHFVVPHTVPLLSQGPPVTSPYLASETPQDLQMNAARQNDEDSSKSTYLQTIPVTLWLKLIANALSDEVYERYVHRQASPAPDSSDASEHNRVLEEAQAASKPTKGSDLTNEPNTEPSGQDLRVKPLPAFKMNKSMRPYVTTPVPVSPYYTFDKPPHFRFPPSHVPSSHEPGEIETGTETTESTPSEVGPMLDGARGDDQ